MIVVARLVSLVRLLHSIFKRALARISLLLLIHCVFAERWTFAPIYSVHTRTHTHVEVFAALPFVLFSESTLYTKHTHPVCVVSVYVRARRCTKRGGTLAVEVRFFNTTRGARGFG